MIVWLMSRGVTRRRFAVAVAILAADFVLGPILLAWEWRVLRPYLIP